MTNYADRAEFLAKDLRWAQQRLSEETTVPLAVLFLDSLARLEAYEDAVLVEAGAYEAVALAKVQRDEAGADLGALIAEQVEIESLWERGGRIADGSSEESATEFGLDLLKLANIRPWLPKEAQVRWGVAIEKGLTWLDSHPKRFLSLPALAENRVLNEVPTEAAATLLHQFGRVAIYAAVDAILDEVEAGIAVLEEEK